MAHPQLGPAVSDDGAPKISSVIVSASNPTVRATFCVVLFSTTMLLSAFLLLSVEPMVAKMALPLLGGTSAVWNTCLVFFQAVLLAGYVYAHLSAKLLSQGRQIVLHLFVLLIALMVLPLHLPTAWVPPVQHNPALWLLALLSVSVGLPFFEIGRASCRERV